MAQFDSLIIFSLIFSLYLILILYYMISLYVLIPDFLGIKKFRKKKSNSFHYYKVFNKYLNIKTQKSYQRTI